MKKGYKTIARKKWSRAYWIEGQGPYALVSYCHREGATVTLHETWAEADTVRKRIDATGCGSSCSGKHYIYNLDKLG